MRILVVCGAGASSTFVAQRLRRAARANGIELDAAAVPRPSLGAHLSSADAVLVGPHLPDLDDVRAEAAGAGIPVVTLPADVFADADGSRILDLIPAAKGTP